MSAPLLTRKRDTLYLVFFTTHIIVLLLSDLAPFYPPAIRPSIIDAGRDYYIATFHDRLFTDPPAWFGVYVWMELLLHLPVSVYAVRGLWYDDPFLPIPLLVFAVQTAVTTLTCIAEALSWDHLDASGKASLVAGLYSPYLAVAVFMTVDMVRRLSARMERAVVLEGKATEKDRKGEGMGLLKSGKGE